MTFERARLRERLAIWSVVVVLVVLVALVVSAARASADPQIPSVTNKGQSAAIAFRVILESDDDLNIYPLGDVLAVTAGRRVALLEGELITQRPALTAGLPKPAAENDCSLEIEGRWPDAAWLSVSRTRDTRAAELYRWNGKGWTRRATAPPYHGFLKVYEDPRGLVAIHETHTICNTHFHDECGSPSPHPAPPPGCPTEFAHGFMRLTGTGPVPSGEHGYGVNITAALPNGELMIVTGTQVRISTAKTSRTFELPGVPAASAMALWLHGALFLSPREGYLAGEIGPVYDAAPPYLARFDGSGWTKLEVPFSQGVKAMERSRQGTFWFAVGVSREGMLWSWRDGVWTKHPVPGWTPYAVWASSDENVVVAAREAGCGFPDKCRTALLRSGSSRVATQILPFPSICPAKGIVLGP